MFVGRGGLVKPIPGGTYAVSDALVCDLKAGVQGQHASNLGGLLARKLLTNSASLHIVDPPVVDEMIDIARLSGVPEIPRKSIFIPLNQKAIARRYAKEIGKNMRILNLIVVHMGGGVSCGAHEHGKVIDVLMHWTVMALFTRKKRRCPCWRTCGYVLFRSIYKKRSI